MMKSVRVQLMVPLWLKEVLVEGARRREVSMAEYIRDILKGGVKDGI